MDDLKNDPVYPFFQSTCKLYAINRQISVCPGDSIHLKATGGSEYQWNGPSDFSSELQNPSLADAGFRMSGKYIVYISAYYDCEATDTVHVLVNPLPMVSITSSDDTLCENEVRLLTGWPAGGRFFLKGPGSLSDNVLTAINPGEIFITYSYEDVCANADSQSIISSQWPVAYAGTNQSLEYYFETRLEGTLQPRETGLWSLVSGTADIIDSHSPETQVTGLSVGENVFQWTVSNGACKSGSRVTVTVQDLVIPTVFTPNGDGINDKFYIGDGHDEFEITVFNQWGLTEYESHSYVNEWDGRNSRGNKLAPETYFYVLKFENGRIKKGTILIVN
jgi:gliding motility-associated-like protein